jgi:hypothetical protein
MWRTVGHQSWGGLLPICRVLGGADVMSIPAISAWLTSSLFESLLATMIWPQQETISFMGNEEDEENIKMPLGQAPLAASIRTPVLCLGTKCWHSRQGHLAVLTLLEDHALPAPPPRCLLRETVSGRPVAACTLGGRL